MIRKSEKILVVPAADDKDLKAMLETEGHQLGTQRRNKKG
jgi:hypothetical protein